MWANAGLIGLIAVAVAAVSRAVQLAIALRKTEPIDRPDIIRALNEGTASGAVARRTTRRSARRAMNADRTDSG